MNKTYNADSSWYWGANSGPKAAIDFYEKVSGDNGFHMLFDHPDRQKLGDGSTEYTAHPYLRSESGLGTYQDGADALEDLGWTLTLTGTETSEYATMHAKSGCWTARVSIRHKPFEERVLMAAKVEEEIAAKKELIKLARQWNSDLNYGQLVYERDQLKRKKALLLRSR
jgi:hypothetical protein